MKINSFVLLVLIVFTINLSQSQTKHLSVNNSEENGYCKRKRNLNFKNRIKNFPFNLSSEIILVSHKTIMNINDSIQVYSKGIQLQKLLNSIKIGQDTVNKNEFLESKKLNLILTEKLTDIFYNYGYKTKNYTKSDTKCYNPKNAILFIDKDNKVISFIEICFGCNKMRTSNENNGFGEYCEQKYDLVKQIFKESGIKYGITERD